VISRFIEGSDLAQVLRASPPSVSDAARLVADGLRQLLAKDKDKTPPQWYVNGQGQTMVLIPGPVDFLMGSPKTEAGRYDDEHRHKKRINRTFAVASKAVTMEQYRRFDGGYQIDAKFHRIPDLPVTGISWYQAAAYCNWLSQSEGIGEDQQCYEINRQVTKLKPNYLGLMGYRLPTEAEMEYATRAGASTSRFFGETDDLLPNYAWYLKNSQERTWPVGSLKPNDFGLFDAQGNAYTWCQESYKSQPRSKSEEADDDEEDDLVIVAAQSRPLRGGSFSYPASFMRSAFRSNNVPSNRRNVVGFRVAKTFSLGLLAASSRTPKGPKTKSDE
jgi:eukaryotic-like serine/threonine-protein kinase